MNTQIVSRRVQWALLIFLVLTLIVFAPLMIAVLIGLTVAITVYPFYYSLYRYFQISERSGKTETFFALAITLVISFGFLVLLALPAWIIIENREDIIRGGREILVSLEEFDLGAMFQGVPIEEGEEPAGDEPDADPNGDDEVGDVDEEAGGASNADGASEDAPPGTGEAGGDPGGAPSGQAEGNVARQDPAVAAVAAVTGEATPDAVSDDHEDERADPLITPEQIRQAVTGLATHIIGAIPMLLLKFFIFASLVYLGLRYGASLWRRLLIALELQTRDVLQRMAGTTYRTLYAIYVVHFTTVVITFVFAIPLFIFLGPPYIHNVLLWALICALFQLIPFLGPSLIVLSLIALEFFKPGNVDVWRNVAILFFYGYIFVTIVPDYVFRPMLMGRTTGQNSLVMWLGFFGGIAVMGPAGFVFGPLILSLLNEGINIVLQRYPDPMLQQQASRNSAWSGGDAGPPLTRHQAFGEIGAQTSGLVFIGAGATAEEDAALREGGRPPSGSSSSASSSQVSEAISPNESGAKRLERPPAAEPEVRDALPADEPPPGEAASGDGAADAPRDEVDPRRDA